MFHLRRARNEQSTRDEEWRSLVRAVTGPSVSELDEERFRDYVQRHVLAGPALEEQTTRRRRPDARA